MIYLWAFEDTFGMCDLCCQYKLNTLTEKKTTHIKRGENELIIRRDVKSSGILSECMLYDKCDVVALFYDMDGQEGTDTFLSSSVLYKKLSRLEQKYPDTEFVCLPTVFCAESIELMLAQVCDFDVQFAFNDINTAHMHSEMLDTWLHTVRSRLSNLKVVKYKRTRDFMHLLKPISALPCSSAANDNLQKWLSTDIFGDMSEIWHKDGANLFQQIYEQSYLDKNHSSHYTVAGREFYTNRGYGESARPGDYLMGEALTDQSILSRMDNYGILDKEKWLNTTFPNGMQSAKDVHNALTIYSQSLHLSWDDISKMPDVLQQIIEVSGKDYEQWYKNRFPDGAKSIADIQTAVIEEKRQTT